MPIAKIKSQEDLRRERKRLKLELKQSELLIKEDLQWVKTELTPIRAAGKMVGNALVNKNKGLVNDGVRIAIDTIVKNLILSRAGWITRMVVPFVLKNISTNFIKEKKPEVLSTIRSLLGKARQATNHRSDLYDKSTAAETRY
jgi:hypothetical protein